MKIIISTTFTSYMNNVQIKPTSSYWQILNMGTSAVYINDEYIIRQLYSSFGVDATDILIPLFSNYIKNKKAIKLVNDTAFNIKFGIPSIFGPEYPPRKFLLIQTFFKIQR